MCLSVRLSPPCAGEERSAASLCNPCGVVGGLYSPLSRGLREFTESRRPLPPRRGLACCSSFAVAPSLLIHPPASRESPRNSKYSSEIRGARLFWDHGRRRQRGGREAGVVLCQMRSRDEARKGGMLMVEKSNFAALAGYRLLLLSLSWLWRSEISRRSPRPPYYHMQVSIHPTEAVADE